MTRVFRSDDTDPWQEKYGSGVDGALTISADTQMSVAASSCSGTSGAFTLTLSAASTFANNDLILIHQSRGTGAGKYELNKILSGGGTTTLTLKYALQQNYVLSGQSVAQVQKLPQYTNVTINTTKIWSTPDWTGTVGGLMVFLASGHVQVVGTVKVGTSAQTSNGGGYRGGLDVAFSEGHAGEGTAQDNSLVQFTSNTQGGGGARSGANLSGAGGGGHATTGGAGSGGGGSQSGQTAGVPGLTEFLFGGAGGSTAGNGGGGNGAGILLIIGKFITVTGAITANGAAGPNGAANAIGAGGGGAGGSILLKGDRIVLGAGLVTASGGNGGTGFSGGANGGAGGDGRIHVDYGTSLSGTTTPTLDSRQDTSLIDSVGYGIL